MAFSRERIPVEGAQRTDRRGRTYRARLLSSAGACWGCTKSGCAWTARVWLERPQALARDDHMTWAGSAMKVTR